MIILAILRMENERAARAALTRAARTE